jgi:uncharacterized ferredoxin-like protein
MPILDGQEQERQGVMETANLMVVSARTAPKSGGVDDILTSVVYGAEVEALAADMEKIGAQRNQERWKQQAQNARVSDVIVLIGVRGTKSYVTNCGACGYESCAEFTKSEKKFRQDFDGPTCIFKAIDLGIAVGSAVKTASLLNVDNRIMYRAGVVARQMGLIDADFVMGIPLSVTGKSIYFDR